MVLRLELEEEKLGRIFDYKEGLKRALLAFLFWIILIGLASMLPEPGEPLRLSPPSMSDVLTPDMAVYVFLAFTSGLLHRTPIAPVLSMGAGLYVAGLIIQMPGEITVEIPQGTVQVDMSPLVGILVAWVLLDSLLWTLEPISWSRLKREAGR